MTRNCDLCTTTFEVDPKFPDTKECSQECYDALGTILSERAADPQGLFL